MSYCQVFGVLVKLLLCPRAYKHIFSIKQTKNLLIWWNWSCLKRNSWWIDNAES